ncbi:MAG: adenylate/guanylate cyclase domain-containing protein, partial [Actinomycetota bacterium]|nr:adenylate/guanylate cyclase domain-containing protein [Actinomycetota bacterium]
MRSDFPSGTVTFLFTDVEGSTRLLHELGAEGYAAALAEHRRIVREAFHAQGGLEVDTQGDAFFVAFPTAPGALAAVEGMLAGLAPGPIRVRMGLHTGTPFLTEEGYVGPDVNRAARIAACGHGRQVLVSASTASLLGSDGLRDLGEHRLKDLSAPERIYQLGENEFPPLKSLYRTNLPVPATAFLGRDRELAEVVELLSREDTRLLTLTGPGGMGKTRLGLQAAAEASDSFPYGVFWVPLAPLRDPDLVLETAAQVVGSKNGLAEHIADKELLLLFDNFEHVVEAGAELGDLLAACPNLELLVTSRERLRVRGEQTYPVPPLAESDGEALFVARARAVDPSFAESEAVGELCTRLDELPLALELAAARTALFSPEQLLERLSQRLDLLKGERDADPRQQTLRATIAWSHDLLTEDEQRLFARLSVFAGGCSYESAEEIAGADPDTLESLLDKSLLRKRDSKLGPRYWMLETIREFAAERLELSGPAGDLHRRHAEHFLALAQRLAPHLPVTREWLDEIEAEHDNVRAALDRLGAVGETQLAQLLAEAIWRFWKLRGHQAESQRRFDALLAADDRPTSARAHALNAAAGMAVENKDYLTGRHYAEEALAIHEERGDAWGTARSFYMLGYAAIESGDFETAMPLFEKTVELLTDLGYEHFAGMATFNLAWACEELGEVARAKELTEQNLVRARSIGSPALEATALVELAAQARDEG